MSSAEMLTFGLNILDAKFPALLFPFLTWAVGGFILTFTLKTKYPKRRAAVFLFALASGLMFCWWYVMPFLPWPSNWVWEFIRTFGVALKHAFLEALGANTVLWSAEVEAVSVGTLIHVSRTKRKRLRQSEAFMWGLFGVLLAIKVLILLVPYFEIMSTQ
jgi:hypothetical protein